MKTVKRTECYSTANYIYTRINEYRTKKRKNATTRVIIIIYYWYCIQSVEKTIRNAAYIFNSACISESVPYFSNTLYNILYIYIQVWNSSDGGVLLSVCTSYTIMSLRDYRLRYPFEFLGQKRIISLLLQCVLRCTARRYERRRMKNTSCGPRVRRINTIFVFLVKPPFGPNRLTESVSRSRRFFFFLFFKLFFCRNRTNLARDFAHTAARHRRGAATSLVLCAEG